MDTLIGDAKGEVSLEKDKDVVELIKKAEEIDIDLVSKKGIQKTTKAFVDLFGGHTGKTLDIIFSDPVKASTSLGTILLANQEKPALELVPLIVSEADVVPQELDCYAYFP